MFSNRRNKVEIAKDRERQEDDLKILNDDLKKWRLEASGVSEGTKDIVCEEYLRVYREKSDSLNLPGLGLTSIPTSLGLLTSLKTLDLSHNQLTDLPESIGDLTSLNFLNASGNSLTAIPGSIEKLKALTYLNLSNNKITVIPDAVGSLPNLSDIDLSNNGIVSIPPSMTELDELLTFNISNNKIEVLPAMLRDHSTGQTKTWNKLQIFNISENLLKHIPLDIIWLPYLRTLNIQNNRTPEKDIARFLTQIQSKLLSESTGRVLSTLSYSTYLEGVEHQDTINYKFKDASRSRAASDGAGSAVETRAGAVSAGASAVTEADRAFLESASDVTAYGSAGAGSAGGGSAGAIDESAEAAHTESKLETLTRILDRWVSKAPGEENRKIAKDRIIVAQTNSLEVLDLSNLGLSSLPDVFAPSSTLFPYLKKLDLSNNQFTKIPHITKLSELDLSHNQIQSISNMDCQMYLSGLSKLDLSHNQLKSIPPFIRTLNKLEELNLSNNNISTIPEGVKLQPGEKSIGVLIGDWINLKILNLSHNPLVDVPDSVLHNESIRQIILNGIEKPVMVKILARDKNRLVSNSEGLLRPFGSPHQPTRSLGDDDITSALKANAEEAAREAAGAASGIVGAESVAPGTVPAKTGATPALEPYTKEDKEI